MRDRWLVLGTAATIGAALATAVAQAGPRTERVSLDRNGTAVSATATIVDGALSVSVSGMPPRARVEAIVDRLACATSGFDGRPAGGAVADARGSARWTVRGVLRPETRDGRHVLAVVAAGQTVACGPIPSAEPAAGPSPRSHWGTWSFAGRFLD